jgi:hypothetical protein
MAEKVKRRVAAARLAVAFVAAGTIAGATAWAEAGPPPTAQSSASDIFAKIGDIKGEQIQNHSLKYVDFAKGEVPSFDQFQKLDETFKKYKKAENAFKYDIKSEVNGVNGDLNTVKGELGNVNGDLSTIKAELGSFVKSGDAIMGDGSVFTATKAITQAGSFQTLLDLPNLVKVEMNDTMMQVTNTSGGTLTFSACTGGAGGGVLQPGKTTSCSTAGDAAQALQMVNGDGRVLTLNFSNLSTPGGSQGTVQILIGL